MKFLIEGSLDANYKHGFKLELEATSEKHAIDMALARMGSKYRIARRKVSITKIEKVQ
ncbi:MAG: 50S ribosomal protein L18Ae [Candidatus Marsarchaeota archaeon]|jgi:ribosomal protein L20A (L18A)|nr:50S ribosomal protein L18Ae [Candidatus Marsarchaeota archaeon]